MLYKSPIKFQPCTEHIMSVKKVIIVSLIIGRNTKTLFKDTLYDKHNTPHIHKHTQNPPKKQPNKTTQ